MKIENKIGEVIKKVLVNSGFTPHSIILFGSRARGDFSIESDFDILVVIKEDMDIKERRKLRTRISIKLHEEFRFVSFDVIVKSLKDFEKEKRIVNTISKTAFIEGVEL